MTLENISFSAQQTEPHMNFLFFFFKGKVKVLHRALVASTAQTNQTGWGKSEVLNC